MPVYYAYFKMIIDKEERINEESSFQSVQTYILEVESSFQKFHNLDLWFNLLHSDRFIWFKTFKTFLSQIILENKIALSEKLCLFFQIFIISKLCNHARNLHLLSERVPAKRRSNKKNLIRLRRSRRPLRAKVASLSVSAQWRRKCNRNPWKKFSPVFVANRSRFWKCGSTSINTGQYL